MGNREQITLALFILLVAGVIAGGYFLLVKPKDEQIKQLDAQLQVMNNQLKAFEDKKARMQEVLNSYTLVQARLQELLIRIPNGQNLDEALRSFTFLMNQSKIDISSFEPQAENSSSKYKEMPIKLSLDGKYHQLGSFIYGMERLPRIISVKSMKIKAGASASGPTNQQNSPNFIQIELLASLYYSVPEGGN